MKKEAIKEETKHRLNQSVCGVCYKYTNLRKYILWALRLLEDMPIIFTTVKYLEPDQVVHAALFHVYIVDDLDAHKIATADL
jgi:hypothetical protein